MLVSLINDAVQLVIQTQTDDGSGDTIIFPSTTAMACCGDVPPLATLAAVDLLRG